MIAVMYPLTSLLLLASMTLPLLGQRSHLRNYVTNHHEYDSVTNDSSLTFPNHSLRNSQNSARLSRTRSASLRSSVAKARNARLNKALNISGKPAIPLGVENASLRTDGFYHRNFYFGDHDLATHYNDNAEKNGYWMTAPNSSAYSLLKTGLRKLDYYPVESDWRVSSNRQKKSYEPYARKNRKFYLNDLEDYIGLGSDRKHTDASDRKYVHEHEGFFFPIQMPSHHEKEDSLIPLLLLLLLPLLLFAIIIPLNANLLSTLFLIMQNNGANAAAAQLAAGVGRRKRALPQLDHHPSLDDVILQIMFLLDESEELYNKQEIFLK